jgi:hypothetical protein
MIKTFERPATGNDHSMRRHYQINLTRLDYQALTPEQWTLLKRQVAHRGQLERARVVRAIVSYLILRRGKRPAAPFRDLCAEA